MKRIPPWNFWDPRSGFLGGFLAFLLALFCYLLYQRFFK